jgi:hypothetical protein
MPGTQGCLMATCWPAPRPPRASAPPAWPPVGQVSAPPALASAPPAARPPLLGGRAGSSGVARGVATQINYALTTLLSAQIAKWLAHSLSMSQHAGRIRDGVRLRLSARPHPLFTAEFIRCDGL